MQSTTCALITIRIVAFGQWWQWWLRGFADESNYPCLDICCIKASSLSSLNITNHQVSQIDWWLALVFLRIRLLSSYRQWYHYDQTYRPLRMFLNNLVAVIDRIAYIVHWQWWSNDYIFTDWLVINCENGIDNLVHIDTVYDTDPLKLLRSSSLLPDGQSRWAWVSERLWFILHMNLVFSGTT